MMTKSKLFCSKPFASKILVASLILMGLSNPVRAAEIDTFNLQLNPLGLFFGVLNADFDIKILPGMTLGPSIAYVNTSDLLLNEKGGAYGIRSNIYLNGVAYTDSWYVGPFIKYFSFNVSSTSLTGSTVVASGLEAGALAGYKWHWSSFNIGLGLGPVFYTTSNPVSVTDSSGTTVTYDAPLHGFGLGGEFTLGWTF